MADIRGVPVGIVKGLSKPARGSGSDSYRFKSTWSVPGDMTRDSNERRAECLAVRFALYPDGKTAPEDRIDYYWEQGPNTTSGDLLITDFTSNNGCNAGKVVTRESFWPHTKVKLGGLGIAVRAKNRYGYADDNAWAQTWFDVPRAPSITAPTVDTSNWRIESTVATDAGTDMRERNRTHYKMTVYRSASNTTTTPIDDENASTSRTLGTNLSDAAGLDAKNYITVTFEAWARGYAGDSGHTKRSITISRPAQPSITKVTCAGRAAGNLMSLSVKTNTTATHPVDTVKLQVLANTEAETAAAAAAASGWADTDLTDDGNCTGMACLVDNYIPDPGKHTWVRVRAARSFATGTFVTNSAAVEVRGLYTAPAPSASATMPIYRVSAEPGADGRSADIKLGWGNEASTGFELSWSDDPDAWVSTDEPSTYTAQRDDGRTGSYAHGARVIVRGLEEGTTYYFRARRYLEADGSTTWNKYCDMFTVSTAATPASVTLTAPAAVPRGQAVPLWWAFDSPSPQRSWQIIQDSTNRMLATGTDAVGACTLPWSRVSGALVDGVLAVRVRVSTGGGYVTSEAVYVRAVAAPELSVSAAELGAQPLSVAASCNLPGCSVALSVTADGACGSTPTGVEQQPEGDTVWAGTVVPTWTGSGSAYTADIELPPGLDFWDNCAYTVHAAATDPASGLVSETAEAGFTVAFEHQAPVPADGITVEPSATVDDAGISRRTCTVQLAPPDGAAEGDVYDIYRVTPDGCALVLSGAGLSDPVEDAYAPYGGEGLAYRVACRTPDGDVDWADYPYAFQGDVLRIDFPGQLYQYVELPYNVTANGQWDKDFESRVHLDGKEQGYWGASAGRRASYTADVPRSDADTLRALRALASACGPCFVRTPDGEAYEANVDVSGLDSDGGPVVPVSLDATALAPTDLYGATGPLPDEEDEGGE